MSTITPDMIIATARGEIGYKEKPGNNNKYGEWFGMNGVSWCAEFVSWVFAQNKASNLIPNTYNKNGYCGCAITVNFLRSKKLFIPAAQAMPGYLAFFDFNNDGVSDHTGIVVKVDLDKKLITCIEGNTGSGKNQSDGDGVYERVRPFSEVLGIGKVIY